MQCLFWILHELTVYPVLFESSALVAICILASAHTLLHHRKVITCFCERCQRLRALGMARHIFAAFLVASMGFEHFFSKFAMVMMLVVVVIPTMSLTVVPMVMKKRWALRVTFEVALLTSNMARMS